MHFNPTYWENQQNKRGQTIVRREIHASDVYALPQNKSRQILIDDKIEREGFLDGDKTVSFVFFNVRDKHKFS